MEGTIGIPGYHTVQLPTPVSVNTGDTFSVVVRYQTPGYLYPIPIEKPLSGYSGKATAGAGESYTSRTGTIWTDLTSSIANANVCLKVYTVNAGTTAPAAAFSGNPVSGTAPLVVAFTDKSTGNPASWAWSFGDGTSSTVKNPTHTYSSAGTYTVSLTVTGSGGSATRTEPDYITVTAPVPTPSPTPTPVPVPAPAFSATPRIGNSPLNVAFTDLSTESPDTWDWNFGDGVRSTVKNPTHTYSSAGTYTVTLTVTNSGGSATRIMMDYITVTAPTPMPTPAPVPVQASFTASPVSGKVPLTAVFTDTSTGTPTNWNWDFGDGSVATIQNPSHIYENSGVFTVTLTAGNADGSSKVVKKNYIRVLVTKDRTSKKVSILLE
jgi:PKD repeat protein